MEEGAPTAAGGARGGEAVASCTSKEWLLGGASRASSLLQTLQAMHWVDKGDGWVQDAAHIVYSYIVFVYSVFDDIFDLKIDG